MQYPHSCIYIAGRKRHTQCVRDSKADGAPPRGTPLYLVRRKWRPGGRPAYFLPKAPQHTTLRRLHSPICIAIRALDFIHGGNFQPPWEAPAARPPEPAPRRETTAGPTKRRQGFDPRKANTFRKLAKKLGGIALTGVCKQQQRAANDGGGIIGAECLGPTYRYCSPRFRYCSPHNTFM